MSKIAKKEIRQGIEKAIGDYVFKIETSAPSKKVSKLIGHHSKKLAEAIKDEMKKKASKAKKEVKPKVGKVTKTTSAKKQVS